jgi:ATP-dependent Clp protease protease subunit
MSKTVCIRFMASVNDQSIRPLLNLVDQKLREGTTKFVLLVSSPGGTVFDGLSAYNYLKGVPAEIITHNFGSVDSIGVVMYCAGRRRLSVPHARFLIHGVHANFPQGAALEDKQLEERLKGLRLDEQNIAGVIAANTGRSERQVYGDMLKRLTLNPEQAKEYGLVHEIKEALIEPEWELHSVQSGAG